MLDEQCALMRVFRKRPGCVLIGACALIRTNTVIALDVLFWLAFLLSICITNIYCALVLRSLLDQFPWSSHFLHENVVRKIVVPSSSSDLRCVCQIVVKNMSRLVGKPTMWFPNRSDTNRPVQAQKTARSMKFRI